MRSPAVVQGLTDAQARGIVSPRYCLFNVAPEATSIDPEAGTSTASPAGVRLAARPRASCLVLPHGGDQHPDDQGWQDRQDLLHGELAERP